MKPTNLKISRQIWLASVSSKNLTVADQGQHAWKLLTDIQNWHHWLPQLISAIRTDGGDPGRGSKLVIVFGNARKPRSNTWTISYWEPPNRIDLIVQSPNTRVACSVRLDPQTSSAAPALAMELEIELKGLRKLLKPLYLWSYRRKSSQVLTAFANFWSKSNG